MKSENKEAKKLIQELNKRNREIQADSYGTAQELIDEAE